MKPNQQLETYVNKADMVIGDLTSGGRIPPDVLKKYIVVQIKQSVMMKYITVMTIGTPEYRMPRMTTMGGVMQPGTSGQALAYAERSKPGLGEVTLTSQLVRAEVDYPEEVLEDQIERGVFANSMAAYAALHTEADVEQAMIYGDPTGVGYTAWMKLFTGFLTASTSYVTPAAGATLSGDILSDLMETRLEQFDDDANDAFYTNRKARSDYRKSLKNRGTPLGDAIIGGSAGKELGYEDIPLRKVPYFPNNLGVDTNQTNVWYGNSRQIILAWYRKMKVSTDYQPKAGKYSLIINARIAMGMEYEPACAKASQVRGS